MSEFEILRELHRCGSEEMLPDEIPKLSSYFGLFSGFQDVELKKPLDTIGVRDMSYCYSNCKKLQKIDYLHTIDTSRLRELSGMFRGCSSFRDFEKIADWNTSNVLSLKETFRGSSFDSFRYISKWDLRKCSTFTNAFSNTMLKDLEGFNNLRIGNVKSFERCFADCEQLVSLKGSEYLMLDNVTSIDHMFDNCPNLFDITPFFTWRIPLRLINRTIFENCPRVPRDWFERFELEIARSHL